MIPASFSYVRADSIEHALDVLHSATDAKLLAGGGSLLPLLRLRLAAPATLVDISEVDALNYIQRRDSSRGPVVALGAGARFADIASSDVVRQSIPLLGRAAARIADAQLRYRGTIGGSLAHADPAADLPATVLALDGQIVIRSTGGERTIPAERFFLDFFTTELADDEVITEVIIPVSGAEKHWYEKFVAHSGAWATVAVAVAGTRIALAGMGATPIRAEAAEDVLASGGDFEHAAEVAAHGLQPVSDAHADADYRRHLARVLVLRALQSAHRP